MVGQRDLGGQTKTSSTNASKAMENRANRKVLDEGRGWTAFSLGPFQREQHAFSVDTVKMRVTDRSFFTILVYTVLFLSDSPGIRWDLFSELRTKLQGNYSTQNKSVTLVVKNLPGEVTEEVSSPGSGRSPEGKHGQPTPVFLPGECPWTEEPGGLQSIGSQRVNQNSTAQDLKI